MPSSKPRSQPDPVLPDPQASDSPAAEQKRRTGLNRIFHAGGFSLAGLRQAWQETAFRQEATFGFFLVPLGLLLGQSWVERVLLTGSVVLVMIVELLNTAVESAIDRIGPEWHELSKRAKDIGSAAVLLALLLCGLTWGSALWARFA